MLSRRSLGALSLALAGLRAAAAAEDSRYLRIGTGPVSGTYFPVAELIAGLISMPDGDQRCDPDLGCGVRGLILVAQTSKGSVENVTGIEEGQIESGFAQSDVAYGAFSGTGVFNGRPPMTTLRALASLYVESVHLVARSGSGIGSVADLRGRRVSLDVEGSGTLVDARLILAGHNLTPEDLQPVYAPLGRSLDLMSTGELDALFLVAGYPAPAIAELTRDGGATLVPIAGVGVEKLLREHRFFTLDNIPAETYPGLTVDLPTLGVAALWVVSATLDPALVYEITAALWRPGVREALPARHPKGASIRLEHALRGVAIPLHPGAARYYREHGVAE